MKLFYKVRVATISRDRAQGDVGYYRTLSEALDGAHRDAKKHFERWTSDWIASGNENKRVWRRNFGYGVYTIEALKFGDIK